MNRGYIIGGAFFVLFLVFMISVTFMGGKTLESPQNQAVLNTPPPEPPKSAATIAPKPIPVEPTLSTSASPITQAATQEEYWIAGYVTAEEGKALPGSIITVFVEQKYKHSSASKNEKKVGVDEKGYYTIHLDGPVKGFIHSLPPEGYLSLGEEFSLTQSQPTLAQHFAHPPAPHYIQGKVINAQTKSPIEGAEITAMCHSAFKKKPPQHTEKAISKEDGSFKITRLTQGNYSLMASAEGYVQFLAYKIPNSPLLQIDVPKGSRDNEYLIEMQPGSAAEFYVVNPMGQPVEKAEIQITGDESEWDTIGNCTTNRNGTSTNTNLPKRTLYAEASHPTEGRGFSKAFTPGMPTQPIRVEIALQTYASVSGKVLDSGGNTVPDKEVDAELQDIPGWKYPTNLRVEPDQNGDYSLDTLAPGSYRISLTRSHHYPVNPIQSQTLELKAGEHRTGVDFIMNNGETYEIKGKVIDKETSEPLEGASVSAFPLSDTESYHNDSMYAKTDANGEFLIKGFVKKGDQIQFHISGKEEYLQTNQKRPFGESYYTLAMKKGGQITGIVLDDNDQPLAGAQVYPVRMYSGRPYHETHRATTTDDDGAFTFSKLDPMDYQFHAKMKGFPEADSETISVREGQKVDTIIIRMEKGIEISGVIVDPQGQPIANAILSILSNVPDIPKNSYGHPFSKPNYPQDAISDGEGQFQIDNFPSQGDTLVVQHNDFAPTLFAIDTSMIAQSPFTIRMTLGGGIAGTTYGLAGKKEANVALNIQNWPENQFKYKTLSDEEGEYRFEHLAPASYMVLNYGPNDDYKSQQYKTVLVEEGKITRCDFGGGEGAVIRGTVYKRGQISPNAQVALSMRRTSQNQIGYSLKAVSDRQGAYSFPSLEAGEYTIMVTTESSETTQPDQPLYEGNCEYSAKVLVTEDQSEYTVDLHIASLEIQGVVLDEETNEPIAEAKIEPRLKINETNPQGVRNLETQTKSDGSFTLLPMESGSFTLAAIKDGYQAKEFEITVPPFNSGETMQPIIVKVYLKKDDMAIYLRLFLEEKPAVSSWINVVAESQEYNPQILPSTQIEEGYYKVYGMQEGELEIRVTAYCFSKMMETLPQRLTIRPGEQPQLMLNLYAPDKYGVMLVAPDNQTLDGLALLELTGFSEPVSFQARIRSNPERDIYNFVPVSIHPEVSNVRILVPGYQAVDFNPADYPKQTENFNPDDLIRLPLIPQ